MGSTRGEVKSLMMGKLSQPGPPKCEGICYVFLQAKDEKTKHRFQDYVLVVGLMKKLIGLIK